MRSVVRAVIVAMTAGAQCACGFSPPQMPEIWDRADERATQHMQMQIKRAVYCELRDAIRIARGNLNERYYGKQKVTTSEDQTLPDSWGAQITFTFTIDETSKLTPNVSLNTVYPGAVSTFSGRPSVTTPQNFTLGFGGTFSSQATRVDTFDTFYTIGDIAYIYSKNNICDAPNPDLLGPASHSSPFLVQSELGIKDWLPQAVQVADFLRSSRAAETGEGPALGGSAGHASDSLSYQIKYIIISSANVTPTWKLVRITGNNGTLFDMNRTRTHQLLITIAPGKVQTVKTKKGMVKTVTPSPSATNSHLAQQIGNAVGAAVRAQAP
jgi:hypothetical protein